EGPDLHSPLPVPARPSRRVAVLPRPVQGRPFEVWGFGSALGYPLPMQIAELQDVLRRTYLDRDAARGPDGVFRWMVEEVGEVARAMRNRDAGALEHEMSDVLAWLGSLANLLDVDLERAAARYANGCPRCGALPCTCEVRP